MQDPEQTNAKLFKAGITSDNGRGYTSDEICKILDVEYLISGTVNQHKQQVSISSTYTMVKETPATTNRKGKETSKEGDATSTSSSSYTSDNYTTKVTLKLHNDKGDTLFSGDHESIWSGPEAYKNAFAFLWKKTPLFSK